MDTLLISGESEPEFADNRLPRKGSDLLKLLKIDPDEWLHRMVKSQSLGVGVKLKEYIEEMTEAMDVQRTALIYYRRALKIASNSNDENLKQHIPQLNQNIDELRGWLYKFNQLKNELRGLQAMNDSIFGDSAK